MGLPFLVFAVAGNEHWLQNNVATALKAQTAIRQAAIWANGHQKECREMLAPFMKIDQKVADTMLLRQFGTTINTPLIAPVIDVMVRYGFLDKPLAPAEMIWKPA
jgi:ABC-type nitrate/sulfonate/bicarbonate transport system substrate-binding protein